MKGATADIGVGKTKLFISIHAPVKGATLCNFTDLKNKEDFNPRTREGCDNVDVIIGDEAVTKFQSTHP